MVLCSSFPVLRGEALAGSKSDLISKLYSPSWAERRAAAQQLGGLRERAALRHLVVRAKADPHPEVRAAAAQAVALIEPRRYVSDLATSDPPPVQRRPPEMTAPPQRSRLLAIGTGLGTNLRRASHVLVGTVHLALRFEHVDLQAGLSFPALAAALGPRWLPLGRGMLAPYVLGAMTVSFNNGRSTAAAISLCGGLGMRITPVRRFAGYVFAESMISWTFNRPNRGEGTEISQMSKIAIPFLVGVGIEVL